MTQTHGGADHPAPHREQTSTILLFATLMAGPTAWITELLFAYGASAYFCQPQNTPRVGPPPHWGIEWPLMLAVNLLCIVGAIAGALAGFSAWRRTRAEKPGESGTLLEVGEGRTRFLAACGIMACSGFAVAIVFNTVEFFTVPACW